MNNSNNYLNLGILAHVDAGKTSLTERLLYIGGVIEQIGSVDSGNTVTDSLELERQRGITIKSAVASFAIGERQINLIDTPGHSDFIAEVERVLNVLDACVLVISAVEGVQAQTRVLYRTLKRLGIPTVIFVNKIDRMGARYQDVIDEIKEKLTTNILAMGSVENIGTTKAEFKIFVDNDFTFNANIHPVFFGSAITGAGTTSLIDAIKNILPLQKQVDNSLNAYVFKIERGKSGEKIAYVRMFSGMISPRNILEYGDNRKDKVTYINIFENGSVIKSQSVKAGQIAKLWGLSNVQIGDVIGTSNITESKYFAPPTQETIIFPKNKSDKGNLHSALKQLEEQDPLINLRQDDNCGDIYVSLYGEVQAQVIQTTLLNEYGIEVDFRELTTICIERPIGMGSAFEKGLSGDPFLATIGLRIEPGEINSGIKFQLEVEYGSIPLSYHAEVVDTTYKTLKQGLYGWEVTDCIVTMTHSGYWPRQSHSHAKFDKSMSSTQGDFRGLTPLVLMQALSEAKTQVLEPVLKFRLEIPQVYLNQILSVITNNGTIIKSTNTIGTNSVLEGEIVARNIFDVHKRLPELTSGQALLESEFDHYEKVKGERPVRLRTDNNPLNRKEYLLRVLRNL